jgi:[acyl-carrier-protein] S-malonyltransferase
VRRGNAVYVLHSFQKKSSEVSTCLEWAACMDSIVEMRPGAVLEVGPGSALTKMLFELEPGLEARAVDEFGSIEAAAHWAATRAGGSP